MKAVGAAVPVFCGPSGRCWLWVVLLAMALLASGGRAAEPVAVAGRAMGTTWSVKYVPPSKPLPAGEVVREVAARLEALERIFSTYGETSELSRFNATSAHAMEWFPVSAELARVARDSRRISELTDGAFDATVDPLVRLWGFGPRGLGAVSPTPREIETARSQVGWRRLEVRESPPALRCTTPGVTADFSSMAKGFATDALSELLASLGAGNHLVQIGGDIRAAGPGPNGTGWRVGIESPTDRAGGVARVVDLHGQALSTAGNYRNVVSQDGRLFGHIIDPRTGRPVTGELASVAVVHATCAESSAWATALFVLGADRGFELAASRGLAGVFFVRSPAGDGFVARETPALDKARR